MVTFEPEQTTALNDLVTAVLEGEQWKRRKAFLYGVAVGTLGSCGMMVILRWLQS